MKPHFDNGGGSDDDDNDNNNNNKDKRANKELVGGTRTAVK